MSEQPPIPNTLLPCPFCGGKAKLKQYDGRGYEPSSAMIDCDSCNICSTDWQPAAKMEDSLSIARQLWNTRVHPTPDRVLATAVMGGAADEVPASGDDEVRLQRRTCPLPPNQGSEYSIMGGAGPKLADARPDASEAQGSAAGVTEETPPANCEIPVADLVEDLTEEMRNPVHDSSYRRGIARALAALRPHLRTPEPVSVDLTKSMPSENIPYQNEDTATGKLSEQPDRTCSETLISAAEGILRWFDQNYSDTDFDMDGNMANVHADLAIATYHAKNQPKRESGWQSMETAPADGTYIIILKPEWNGPD